MPAEEPVMRVRLMVYSGRPNPEWDLSGAESKELTEALERGLARDGQVAPPAPPGLGYRGFMVTPVRKIAAGLDQPLIVHRRVISRSGRKQSESFVDAGGAEQILLRQARDHGQGEVLSALGVGTDED